MAYNTRALGELRSGRRVDQKVSRSVRQGLRRRSDEDDTTLPIYVHMEDDSAYGVGQVLVDLDRELRRSARFVRTGVPGLPSRRAPLEVRHAIQTESAELVLQALGGLAMILLSDPVQFAITVNWFWDHRPQRWGTKTPAVPRELDVIAATVSQSAQQATSQGMPVEYAFDVNADGSMWAYFRSSPSNGPKA